MKPIALKLKGINSFLEEQIIDFKTLTSRGIFGIFGPTGSGKTSILDGITLSLYGDISRNTKDFINANADSAYVSFEFEMSGIPSKRYRVEREFKRNKTGGVTTKYAKMMSIEAEGPVILEDRPLKVNDQCEAVIGLTKEDFTRTVVLPQGKFSEFLKLKNKDRGEMLERIFNLQQYGDELTGKLSAHARGVRLKDTALSGQLKAYEEVSEAIIEQQETLLKEQEKAYEEALKLKKVMDEQFAEAEGVWQLQKDLEQVLLTYEGKKSQGEHYQHIQQKLESAEAAQNLWGSLNQWEKLKESLETLKIELLKAENEKAEATQAYQVAREHFERAQEAKEKRLPILEIEMNRLTEALEKSKVLSTQAENLDQLKRQAYDLRVQLKKSQETLTQLQGEQTTLEEGLKDKLTAGDGLRMSHGEKTLIQELFLQFESIEAEDLRLKAILEKKGHIQARVTNLESEKTKLEMSLTTAKSDQEKTHVEFQRLEKALAGVPEQLMALNQAKQTSENQWRQWDEIQKQLKGLNENLSAINPQIDQMKSQIEGLRTQKNQLEKTLETLKNLEYAIALRKQLVQGEACLVCGALEHPAASETLTEEGVDQSQKESLDQLNREIEASEKQLTVLETRRDEWSVQLQKWQETEANLGKGFLETQPETMAKQYQDLEGKWQADQQAMKHHQLLQEQQQAQLSQCEKSLASVTSGLQVEKIQLTALIEEGDLLKERLQTERSLFLMKQAQQGISDIQAAYAKMKKDEEQLEKLENEILDLRRKITAANLEIEKRKTNQQTLSEQTLSAETQWKVQREVYEKQKAELMEQVGALEELPVKLIKTKTESDFIRQAFETEKAKEKACGEMLKKAEDTFLTTENSLNLQTEQQDQAFITFQGELQVSIFETAEEVKASLLEVEKRQALNTELKAYQEEMQRLQGGIAQLEGKLKGRKVEGAAYEAMVIQRAEKEGELQSLSEEKVALKTRVEQLKSQYELLKNLLEEKEKLDLELAYISDLEKLFQGKRFVGYIAIHQLIYISGKASEQLMDISQGNYGLEIDEEGNFMIRDYKNGGVVRDPASLSGGETFMVSLALALALSAQIQLKGTAPLEFFFLDEGFGTLDEETLDVVMTALERLHHEKLSIGLISHVDSIKSRVPVQLLVSAAKSGISGSRVKVELS